MDKPSFHRWLCDTRLKVPKDNRKGFDTIAALGAWTIWKERNAGFNQKQRTWEEITSAMAAEAEIWRLARGGVPQPAPKLPKWAPRETTMKCRGFFYGRDDGRCMEDTV
uniref:Uncharacterized protein n=1 Tax=Oryza brachyantha TaxID=4533 RepID=J3M1Z3_ORYBR